MAAGRDMRARLLLVLQDGISARLSAIQQRLSGIAGMARRVAAVGTALAALNFAGPIQAAAAYQDTLLQSQITAGGVGQAAVIAAAEAGRAWENLALQTGQRSRELAGAAQNLIAAGLNREDMQAFMPVLARVSTATGASLEDLSRTAVALRQNLNITTAEELAGALAGMAAAGKEGMFELRDMARFFPLLTSKVEGLGVSGRRASNMLAAMLQIARRGAGDAGEAANNLQNFLTKIASPETVRHFATLGTNIEHVLRDAASRGINPIEAVIEEVRRKTGGDPFRMGQIFQDMQVLNFLQPMLRGIPEYQRILEGARSAGADLIDQDFATRMLGVQQQLNKTMETGEQILRRLGIAASGNLGPLNDLLGRILAGLRWLDETYPGVLNQTVSWTVAIVALAAAIGVSLPLLTMLGTGFRIIGVGLGLLSGPVGVVIAAVTALAMAAYYVWKNWATIGPRLQAVWEQLKMVTENVAWFIGEVFKRIVSGLISLFSGMWEGIEQGFTDAVAWIDSWSGGAMTAAINGIKDGWNALTGWFNDIWNSIEGRLNRFVQTAQRILGPIIAIVDRIRAALPGGGSPAEGAAEAPPQVLGNVRARQGAGRAAVGGYYADPLPTGGGTARLNGNLQIGLEPGLVLRSADSDQPGVAVTGSQGPVLGRQ